MTTRTIASLFAGDIYRRIEEVIKVDQTDQEILRDEINEYVVTDAIRSHFTRVLEAYRDTPNRPHEGIAVWVSGFFGSGKSSFAKMLGLAISDAPVAGDESVGGAVSHASATRLFAARTGDPKVTVLLNAIAEKIPTHAVIFDVSTDRGIRSGNQMLTEIMYGLFLHSLGYAKDLDLSELEITLEERGLLDRFEAEYRALFHKEWSAEKGKMAFALGEASRVMHVLDPDTYPMADSWVKAVRNKADITPGKLAKRVDELMKRRMPGRQLIFVIDEVGQFVARDVQKMLDLQAIVQNLGTTGRGRHWIVVTSQEKLNELVSGLDDKRVELTRLMDRFPQETQVHLEPSDISEVTGRRVLAKNAAAQKELGELYDTYHARLAENTRLSADIRLPEPTRDAFVGLYPLLPYQIDLIIQVVSGLRTQGGASRHVGGANRTIIKLAQQVLINPGVELAAQPVGQLARFDQVYDLVESNIGSDVRAKIASIPRTTDHPLAQAVAKAICLLQFAMSVHRTAENIAAVLHPAVAADSRLSEVREALRELEARHLVRLGEDGYRIPTPAEDDWERTRNGIDPKPGDRHRLYAEALAGFWTPQPSHVLLEARTFKAGLAIQGRGVVEGDLTFHMHLAPEGKEFGELAAELRARGQAERKSVFWAVPITPAIETAAEQTFRSREILARKEREARTADENALVADERQRLRRNQEELRRLLRNACVAGAVTFRGNDRGPRAAGEAGTPDPGKSAAEILGKVLPDVFDRFAEGAARAGDVKKGIDALFTADNLNGLPPVFAALGLLRDEKGQAAFRLESGPLAEVLARIDVRTAYGEIAGGRYLAEEFGREPFGWDFDAVRLFALALLRAGAVEAVSRGEAFDSINSAHARETFTNNNHFRGASFRRKVGIEFPQLVAAAEAYRVTFGGEVKELNVATVAGTIRAALERHEEAVAAARAQLAVAGLPGEGVLAGPLGEMRAIMRGSEENAVAAFTAGHRSIGEAIRRAAELADALTEPALLDLRRARTVLAERWPFLRAEPTVGEALRSAAAALADTLERETFFRELPAIDQGARALEEAYRRCYQEALTERTEAYRRACDQLNAAPGRHELSAEAWQRIAAPLERCLHAEEGLPIPQLRADRDACEGRLRAALAELHRAVDGERIAAVDVAGYFADGIETEEQLEAALTGLREECERLIGAGKKVIVG